VYKRNVAIAAVPYQVVGKADTLGTAASLPALNTAYLVTRAEPQATSDYYRVDLAQATTLIATVRDIPSPADYDLHLLHANGQEVIGDVAEEVLGKIEHFCIECVCN
jgi:hypothetical protein